MTYRLVIVGGDGKRYIEDHVTGQEALDAMPSICMDSLAMAVYQLVDLQPAPWSEVVDGDEVLAPDGSLWEVCGVTHQPNGSQTFWLFSLADGRQVGTSPRLDATVQRRPGAVTAVRQLLAEVNMSTQLIRP